jgi:hypothetical protein
MTDDDQETFPDHQHLRQPPPGPPGRPAGKVLVWRRDTDSTADVYEDLMVWRMPSLLAHRFRGAAGARGLTLAQHLSALISLHEAMRQRAESGDEQAATLLEQFSLGTVSI